MDKIPVAVSPYAPFLAMLKKLPSERFEFWAPNQEFTQALGNVDLPAKALGNLLGQNDAADKAYLDAAAILRGAATTSFSRNGKLPEAVPDFMAEKAQAFLYPRLFDLCALARCLDEANPALVLVHNDVENATRTMCLWARARGVPALHVPHATYQDVNRDGPGTDVHDLVTASWLASGGPVQSEWYKRRGFPPANIIETGRPALDPWANLQPDRKRARRRLRIPERARVATYASTWVQVTNRRGANEQWVDAYQSFLLACRDLGLEAIIKLHPHAGRNNWDWHVQRAREWGLARHVHFAPEADHLRPVLEASDLLVAFGGSNVIVEGAFVPGLRLMTTHGYEGEEAVFKTPLDRDGMREAIQSVLGLEPPDPAGFKMRWNGEPDGRAAQRVAELMLRLVGIGQQKG